jgi:hypothetical protein
MSDAAMTEEIFEGVAMLLDDDFAAQARFQEQVDEGTIGQAIEVAMTEYIQSPSFPGLAEAFTGRAGELFLMNVTIAIADTFRQRP